MKDGVSPVWLMLISDFNFLVRPQPRGDWWTDLEIGVWWAGVHIASTVPSHVEPCRACTDNNLAFGIR